MADFKYIVMKELKINAPDGYEIDKEQSTFENIVFKPIVNSLPKTWEELKTVEGYYAGSMSKVNYLHKHYSDDSCENTFVTKEQAEASIALAQLSQLMKVYNDGWIPKWSDCENKYIILFNDNKIKCETHLFTQHFLSFKTIEIRNEFLDNFRDLILTAKPLL